MKKTHALAAAFAALGAAYVGGTYLIGRKIQDKLAAQLDRVTEQLPSVRVTDRHYERGLFHSTRTTTVQLGCEPPDGAAGFAAGPLVFTVRERIEHGPVPGGRTVGLARIESELVLPRHVQEKVAKLFGDEKPLVVRTLVGLGGGFTSEIVSPAFQTQGPKGEQIRWRGLTGTVTADSSVTDLSYEYHLPGVEVVDSKAGVRVALADMRMHGKTRMANGSLWGANGTGEGQLGAIDLSGPAPKGDGGGAPGKPWALSLRELRFTSEASTKEELLTSRIVATGAGTVGDARLDKVELEASFKRVHVPSYQKLMSAMMRGSCDEQARAPQAIFAALQEDLVQLMIRSPEYGIDRLAVELDGKRGELSYSLGVQGVTEADAAIPAVMLLTTKGALKADATVPVAWIERLAAVFAAQAKKEVPSPEMIAGMLDRLVAQGYLLREGEYVKSHVRLANGQLQVNGRPISLGGKL